MKEEIERLNKEAEALRLQDPARAEELARKAQALAHEIGDRAGLAESWLNLAVVYEEKGEDERAIELYCEALAIGEQVSNKSLIATVCLNLGRLYSKKARD